MIEIKLNEGRISRLTIGVNSSIILISKMLSDKEYHQAVNFGLKIIKDFKPDATFRGKIHLYRDVCSVNMYNASGKIKHSFKGM